jgi:hypothetical protein
MGTPLFWTYVAGPLLALLPERWRKALPAAVCPDWERSATVSGFMEILVSLVGLGYWYIFEMTRRIAQIVEGSEAGRVHVGLGEHQVQGAALTIFSMSPLTWILFYFLFEGVLRLCGAAFAENVLGTLPLWLLESVLFVFRNRQEVRPGEMIAFHASSFLESVRERAIVARQKRVPDALRYTRSETEEFLEIRASHRKEDWVPPKIVRVDELYYRLEDSSVERGIRPFRYRLKRLEAGVPGRNVSLYKTDPG